jgi:hypothetical protein
VFPKPDIAAPGPLVGIQEGFVATVLRLVLPEKQKGGAETAPPGEVD